MIWDIGEFIQKKCLCIKDRWLNIKFVVFFYFIVIIYFFEMVLIDFLYLELCSGGYEYILVVVDYFIWFVVVYFIKNKFGCIVVEKMFNDFFMWFGFFDKLYYD